MCILHSLPRGWETPDTYKHKCVHTCAWARAHVCVGGGGGVQSRCIRSARPAATYHEVVQPNGTNVSSAYCYYYCCCAWLPSLSEVIPQHKASNSLVLPANQVLSTHSTLPPTPPTRKSSRTRNNRTMFCADTLPMPCCCRQCQSNSHTNTSMLFHPMQLIDQAT